METTVLSSKGQIVLPKMIRDARRFKPGFEFSVEDLGDDILLKPLSPYPKTTWSDLLGCVGYRGPRRSLEEMEAAIATGAKERR